MYNGKSVSRRVTIGGKTIIVDSTLEERVISKLEINGFHGLWEKQLIGTHRGDSSYTPDLFLAVNVEGDTRRAIVELKPARSFFTTDIKHRMLGIASHYLTDVLLLYAEREDSWYRIDITSGSLELCEGPVPGAIPIKKLYKPLAIPAPSKGSHGYEKAAAPALIGLAADLIFETLKAPFVPPKKNRHRKRRK